MEADRLWMEWVRDQHPAEIAAFEVEARRATVERIRLALSRLWRGDMNADQLLNLFDRLLNEEAAR